MYKHKRAVGVTAGSEAITSHLAVNIYSSRDHGYFQSILACLFTLSLTILLIDDSCEPSFICFALFCFEFLLFTRLMFCWAIRSSGNSDIIEHLSTAICSSQLSFHGCLFLIDILQIWVWHTFIFLLLNISIEQWIFLLCGLLPCSANTTLVVGDILIARLDFLLSSRSNAFPENVINFILLNSLRFMNY